MNQLSYIQTAPSQELKDNYAFLQHSFPELYRLGCEADKYYATDHACCLLKARLFIELWCHEVSDRFNLAPPLSGDLVNKINQISSSGKVPDYIIDALNDTRREANKGAHVARCFDGQWTSDTSVSKTRLKYLMSNLLELAQYLAFKLNKQTEEKSEWHEPVALVIAEHVCASLSGSKDATYALAERASLFIEESERQSLVTGNQKKEHIRILQRDLSYWLDKAHRQGHQETWLMYARVYLKKQLMLPIGQSIDACFKEALKTDDSGEVAFEFGSYLMTRSQYQRGLKMVIAAGEKQCHQAIRFLQEYYYEKDFTQYEYWVNAGVEAVEKRSFTLDLELKLSRWEKDVSNDVLMKKAKSALISAESRQSEGARYYRGYCSLKGYWGKTPDVDKGLKMMVGNYRSIPQFLNFEYQLFELVKSEPDYIEDAVLLADRALEICEIPDLKAQLKFDVAMVIMSRLQDRHQVKSNHGMKKLILDSAKEGCNEANEFVNSPRGTALLRDPGIKSVRTTYRSVDRKKQKAAKKLARKSRRK